MIRKKTHKFRGHLCRLPFDARPRNVKVYKFFSCSTDIPRGLSAYKP